MGLIGRSMQVVCMDLIILIKLHALHGLLLNSYCYLVYLVPCIHAAIGRHANVSKTSNLIYLLLFAQNAQDMQQLLMAYQNWLLPTSSRGICHSYKKMQATEKIVQVADSCLLIVREITPSLNHGWKNVTPITLK